MKKFLSVILIFASAQAKATIETFAGRGLDDVPCSVTILRNGKQLSGVSLTGAAEVFEILSENGSSYGPRRGIDPYAGADTLSLLNEGSRALKYVDHKKMLLSEGDIFSLDTNDIPKTGSDDEVKGLKMTMTLEVYRSGNKIKEVKAKNKATVFLVPLASSKFVCK